MVQLICSVLPSPRHLASIYLDYASREREFCGGSFKGCKSHLLSVERRRIRERWVPRYEDRMTLILRLWSSWTVEHTNVPLSNTER